MSRKIFVINNPTSGGRGKNQKINREIDAFLQSNAIDFELFLTDPDRNAQKVVAEQLNESFSELIIIGGDGTINESVNGLNKDVPVSIIPAGTGNDFVKMLNLPKSLEEQMELAISGNVRQVDLGSCNGRKFVNGVGIGFDGQIVEDMKRKRVPLLKGHAKYYYHVLSILATYKERPFQFSLDGNQQQDNLILMTVGNGTTFGGGFKLMPEARIDDGLLEICTIGKISGFMRFMNVHKLSNGSHGSMKSVDFHQAKAVKVMENPMLFAHLDGEQIGKPPFDIRVLEGALQLRVSVDH
jgi:diacylglycerol kinase (ATP)